MSKKTYEQIQAEIAELQMALARERAENPVRVQPGTGNVSLYKPGRKFPVTLSHEMWRFVLDNTESIKEALGNAAAEKVA